LTPDTAGIIMISTNKGHLQMRTKTESGWKQVGTGGQSDPFYLKDDTGVIRIVPDGAKIQAKSVFNKTCRWDNPSYYLKTSPLKLLIQLISGVLLRQLYPCI
jgi:hypothetical protein